jgi:hypothetical protein
METKQPQHIKQILPSLQNPSKEQTSAVGVKKQDDLDSQLENVELDEEEVRRALDRAKEAKIKNLKALAYRQKLAKATTLHTYTADKLYQDIYTLGKRNYGDSFEYDEWNVDVFQTLCLYFTEDPRFEELDPTYSLNKNLLIFGPVGCGKTSVLRLFSANPLQSFQIVTCSHIQDQYISKGIDGIRQYQYYKPINTNSMYFGQSLLGWAFDDLGHELKNIEHKEANYMGNYRFVMEKMILHWYDTNSWKGNKLHITTNLTGEQIEKIYGERAFTRMSEMFNLVKFDPNAPNRRV